MYYIHYTPCDSFDGSQSTLEFKTKKERQKFLDEPSNQDWIAEWKDFWLDSEYLVDFD